MCSELCFAICFVFFVCSSKFAYFGRLSLLFFSFRVCKFLAFAFWCVLGSDFVACAIGFAFFFIIKLFGFVCVCVCFYRFGFALCLRWRLLRSRFAVLLPGTERARGRGRGWGWGAFFCCVLSQNTADNAKRTRVVTRAPSSKNACNGKIQTANAHKKQCTTTQTTCKQRANRKGKKCQPACLDPLLDIQAGRPAVACKIFTLLMDALGCQMNEPERKLTGAVDVCSAREGSQAS